MSKEIDKRQLSPLGNLKGATRTKGGKHASATTISLDRRKPCDGFNCPPDLCSRPRRPSADQRCDRRQSYAAARADRCRAARTTDFGKIRGRRRETPVIRIHRNGREVFRSDR